MLEDNTSTPTSVQQNALEKKLLGLYQELDSMEPEDVTECLRLLRTVHTSFIHTGIGPLPAGFASLDASHPWIVYWVVHSLALLNAELPSHGPSPQDVVSYLVQCQSPEGGFGGGPMQIPHLAPTYAAVCALATLGGSALDAVNRQAMYNFLTSLIVPPDEGGGFCIHHGGEVDLRACYLAMAVAYILGFDLNKLAERSGVVDYIRRCQTYEGGLGGEPFNEAHGGYTFCGLATLCILNQAHVIDLPKLVHWAAQRQCSMEGGFNGRTNKLVDGCYSFWQGGLFALLQRLPPQLLGKQLVTAPASGGLCMPEVPPLDAILPKTPVEQAAAVLAQKQAVAQNIMGLALAAGERADAALQTSSERSIAGLGAEARHLLNEAGTAQAAAESAHFAVSAAHCSASALFPVPDPTDPPLPAVTVSGTRTIHLGPPLYNYKALQLWLLRCCQQLRGGMRDKPGKPADYYHTCYCLSGLSSSQHVSNCVLGPRENILKPTDPMVNIVEDKLEAARRYYASMGAVMQQCRSSGAMSGVSEASMGVACKDSGMMSVPCSSGNLEAGNRQPGAGMDTDSQ